MNQINYLYSKIKKSEFFSLFYLFLCYYKTGDTMRLIKLNCPNCNAKLEVNVEMKRVVCNYCGTTALLDNEGKIVKTISNKKCDDIKSSLKDNIAVIILVIILSATMIGVLYWGIQPINLSNQEVDNDVSTTKGKINDETDIIRNLGKEFYEVFYWDDCGKYGNEGRKEFLEQFKTVGITVSLENLIRWGNTSGFSDDLFDQYDLVESEIIVYPKEPYGRKDYTISLDISIIN